MSYRSQEFNALTESPAADEGGIYERRARFLGNGRVGTGFNRMADAWVTWRIVSSLAEINLNRWRVYDPDVADKLKKARVAVHELSEAMLKAYAGGRQ